ncbi:MAG: hypothetical protein ACREIC_34345 [Limisphaerales bacterium]
MLRLIVFLLIAILVIPLIRAIIGTIMKGFADLLQTSQPSRGSRPTTPRVDVPLGGELKRDPVCGTFIAVQSSVQETIAGETIYFCSGTCRDKYLAAVQSRR